jgi:hypothetical protein
MPTSRNVAEAGRDVARWEAVRRSRKCPVGNFRENYGSRTANKRNGKQRIREYGMGGWMSILSGKNRSQKKKQLYVVTLNWKGWTNIIPQTQIYDLKIFSDRKMKKSRTNEGHDGCNETCFMCTLQRRTLVVGPTAHACIHSQAIGHNLITLSTSNPFTRKESCNLVFIKPHYLQTPIFSRVITEETSKRRRR